MIYTDLEKVYIAKKNVVEKHGSLVIDGYVDLKSFTEVYNVPASSSNTNDINLYGEKINSIFKFKADYILDIDPDGGSGLWFSEPTPNEDGVYENPEYITNPITFTKRKTLFDATKNE